MKEFPNEPDYYIAEYGNMMIYYSQIRGMYLDAGYKTFIISRISNTKM